jgi:hypothetical protein
MDKSKDYYLKYLKYKIKYIELKNSIKTQFGGNFTDVPVVLPATQSWLYMPLIYSNLDGVRTTFPDDFENQFNRAISQYNNFGFRLEFSNFDEFKVWIRNRLAHFQITNRSDITNGQSRSNISENSQYHIRGKAQERILYKDDTHAGFFSFLAQHICTNMQGSRFEMN